MNEVLSIKVELWLRKDFLTFQAQQLSLNTVELTWSLSSYEILSPKACKLTIIQQKNELCVYLEKIREYLCNYNDKIIGRSTKQKNFDDNLNKILHNSKTFVKLRLLEQQSAICISQPLHNFNFPKNSSVLQWIKFHISEDF